LRDDAFLAELGAADIDALHAVGHRSRFAAGCYVCHEGDASDVAWVLLDGLVKLVKLSRDGTEILIELRGAGDIVGEMGAIDGLPRSAAVVTLLDTDALVLSSDAFRTLLRERPALAEQLERVLVTRLRQASFRQLELATVEVVGRVGRRLLELAEASGERTDDGVLVRGMSQHELASWVGASRDSVVRALSVLREGGLVESGRGRILLRDAAALRDLA
jgi:CRP/FNR family transcriptional regulator, cyclic AMP receptor protein